MGRTKAENPERNGEETSSVGTVELGQLQALGLSGTEAIRIREAVGVRTRPRWLRVLEYIFAPWTVFSLHRTLVERRRYEQIARVEVVRGDMTWQDVEIRLRGELISNECVQRLLASSGEVRDYDLSQESGSNKIR